MHNGYCSPLVTAESDIFIECFPLHCTNRSYCLKVFLIVIIVFKSIFRDVKRAFKTSLAHKLDRLGVSNDGGPQHG